MRKVMSRYRHPTEILFSLLVLGLLLLFTYGIFFKAPYSGLYFNPTTGEVVQIFDEATQSYPLQKGDILQQVGDVSWADFRSNRNQVLFENATRGQQIDIIVQRGSDVLTVPWTFPGFNRKEFFNRLFNLWWLAYIFWFFGMATQLFMRPRDVRWRLLTALNYLTAFFLITGSLSAWQVLSSSILFHAVVWLALPVYLNLHWIFPKPLAYIPTQVWFILYLASCALALSELFLLLPRNLYALGFLLMLGGSITLLIIRFFWRPEQRNDVKPLLVAILIAVIPSVILGVIGLSGNVPIVGPLALIALPIMPVTYFYVVYRQQLGGLELRVNRLISVYVFIILLVTIMPLLVLPLSTLETSLDTMILFTLALVILTTFASFFIFPVFQSFVEQRFLGVKFPVQNLQETYSTRITTSASLSSLLQLLRDEVLPSLFVRQFAFVKLDQNVPTILLLTGITEEQALDSFDFANVMAQAGYYRPLNLLDDHQPFPWVRLGLPLQIENTVFGFWLFGRRDPDDMYSQAEVPVLQSLANQTAIALSNILQTERLRTIYQDDVNRYEEERMRLALELHDSILNQLAVLQMNLDEPSQKFQDAYDGLTKRLREIVSDLRPPMLNYGLKPAIDELADNLMERSKDTVQVKVDLQADGNRYPPKIELHLYRIVQEACENAFRHAQAKHIRISGTLNMIEVDLTLADDGLGFETGNNLQLDTLVANKHFGLAGMIERAMLIDANVRIESNPGKGTYIQITWKPGQLNGQSLSF